MATYTSYGAWAPSSGANKRMRLRFEWDLPDVAPGASSVSVTLRIYLEAGYSFWENTVNVAWSGDFAPGSLSTSVRVSTGGAVLLHTLQGEFPLKAASSTIYSSVSVSGVDYIGASVVASLTDSLTLPAKAATVPAAPATVNTVRSGTAGTAFAISWSAVSGAERYEVWVFRQSTNTHGRLTTTHGLSSSDTMPGDDQYRYGVRAVNAAGASGIAWGPWVRTIPAAPTIALSREGAAVRIEVTGRARYPMGSRVRWRVEGGPWQTLTTTTSGGSLTATHTPTPGTRVQYVADTRVTQPSEVWSLDALSEWIEALAAPAAPSQVGPVGAAPAGEPVRLEWLHRPVDGSAQTAAEVRYRQVGAASWTTVTATTAAYVHATLAAGWWEWQARTRGAHADWGPWSAVWGLRVAARPELTITTPAAGVLRSSRIRPTLGWSDVSGAAMQSWALTLIDGSGTVLERVTGTGPYSPRTLAAVLGNSVTVTLRAEAVSGTGVAAVPVEVQCRTEFLPPVPPGLVARFLEQEGVVELAADARGGAAMNLWPDPDTTAPLSQWWRPGSHITRITDAIDAEVGRVWRYPYEVGRRRGAYMLGDYGLRPGGTYAVSALVHATGADAAGALRVYARGGAANSHVYLTSTPAMPLALDQWRTARIELTIPSDWPTGQPINLGFWIETSTTSVVSWRDIHITEVTPGTPAADTLRIEASYDAGVTWQELTTGMAPRLTTTDPLPPLGAEPMYRAIAVSALPSEAVSEIARVGTVTQRAWIVGMDDGTSAWLLLDMEIAESVGHEVVMAEYEGQPYPTPHYGPGRPSQLTVSGVLTPRFGSPRDVWHRLLGQPVVWRDPTGRRWHATLASGGVNIKHMRGATGRMSISTTVVRISDE